MTHQLRQGELLTQDQLPLAHHGSVLPVVFTPGGVNSKGEPIGLKADLSVEMGDPDQDGRRPYLFRRVADVLPVAGLTLRFHELDMVHSSLADTSERIRQEEMERRIGVPRARARLATRALEAAEVELPELELVAS